jgi:general secretion pathway protein B
MSLILEALKKSEQQRRLGEAPTLGSPALASRRRRSVLPVLAALIVLALGAAGWWVLRKPVAPATPATIALTDPTPAGTPLAVAPSGNTSPHAKPAAPSAPVVKPATATAGSPLAANKPAVPASEAVHAPARANLPLGDRPGSVAQLPPALPAVAGPAAVTPAIQKTRDAAPATAAAPAKPVIAEAKPAAKPLIVETKTTETKSGTADSAKPDTRTATTPAAAAAVPAPTKARAPILPSVWELSYAIRKDLPEMSVTMHVYADDPAERFIVIKGERHVEGDTIADGVTLKQIRPDGMELDFKGTRFTFPRDGR